MERGNVEIYIFITQKKRENEALPELDLSLLYSLLWLVGPWRHVQLPFGTVEKGMEKSTFA